MTIVDDFRVDCALRGHKYSGTLLSYIQEFLASLQKDPGQPGEGYRGPAAAGNLNEGLRAE